MAEPSPPPSIQQPQPSLPQPAFAVPGQAPAIPGQVPADTTATGTPVVDGQTPVVAVVEENPCETLYIQNLNEKVKPQGERLLLLCTMMMMADLH
jgi:hypothetical protein